VLGAASEELIALAVRTAGGAVAGTDDDEAIRLFSLLNGFVLALLGDPFLVGVQGADWPASSLSAAEMEAQWIAASNAEMPLKFSSSAVSGALHWKVICMQSSSERPVIVLSCFWNLARPWIVSWKLFGERGGDFEPIYENDDKTHLWPWLDLNSIANIVIMHWDDWNCRLEICWRETLLPARILCMTKAAAMLLTVNGYL
jgi:hypothetical protein